MLLWNRSFWSSEQALDSTGMSWGHWKQHVAHHMDFMCTTGAVSLKRVVLYTVLGCRGQYYPVCFRNTLLVYRNQSVTKWRLTDAWGHELFYLTISQSSEFIPLKATAFFFFFYVFSLWSLATRWPQAKLPVYPADELLTAAVAVYDCHAEASVIRRTVYNWWNHHTNYRICSLPFLFG